MSFDAFISYSHKDKATADAACSILEAEGIRCWIAPRDVLAGMEWGEAIVDAIDNCRVMILIFSSSANESPQIRREVERAIGRGVPVVPFRIEDVQPQRSLAYFMAGVHWLDALTPPVEAHLKRLARDLEALLRLAGGKGAALPGTAGPSAPDRDGGPAADGVRMPPNPEQAGPAEPQDGAVLATGSRAGETGRPALRDDSGSEAAGSDHAAPGPRRLRLRPAAAALVGVTVAAVAVWQGLSRGLLPIPESRPSAAFRPAWSGCEAGSPDDRIAACTLILERGTESADRARAFSNRSGAYLGKGDNDRAVADASEAIRLNPQDAKAFSNRGLAYANKGDTDRALADYGEAVRLDPQSAEAVVNRQRLLDQKRNEASPSASRSPPYQPSWSGCEAGALDKRIAACTEILERSTERPSRARAFYERGYAYYEKGDYDRAIADASEAIRLDPQYAKAYYDRGMAYQRKGDNDRAIADFDEAIRLNPRDADAFYERGYAHYQKGDYDLAVADDSEAIRLNPSFAEALRDRGIAYRRKGENDLAIADFNEAVRLKPRDAKLFYQRAYAYYEKGDYDRAIADNTEAIRLDPEYGDAYYERGLAYSEKRDYARAIADYKQALRIDPENEEIRQNLERARNAVAAKRPKAKR